MRVSLHGAQWRIGWSRRCANPLARIWGGLELCLLPRNDEDAILRQLPAPKRDLSRVRFVPVDDGYQVVHANGQCAQCDFPSGHGDGCDPAKFPPR